MRMKAIARQGIALLLAVLSLLSLVVGAMALEYDGSGTNGGYASQTGSGKYGIISTNTSTNVIGYRFTGINAQGERANNTKSVDVNELAYSHATKKVSRLFAAERLTDI